MYILLKNLMSFSDKFHFVGKIDQTDILDDSVNRPIILASQVRHEVYFLGAKRVNHSSREITMLLGR
jgi:hypothetical protein